MSVDTEAHVGPTCLKLSLCTTNLDWGKKMFYKNMQLLPVSCQVFPREGGAPLMYHMGFSGRWAHKVQDFDTREWFSCPESHMWLGLGNKTPVGWLRERSRLDKSEGKLLRLLNFPV